MPPQIAELSSRLYRHKFRPVRNAPAYPGGDIIAWMKTEYRGDKPTGGLWTSTYTPDAEYISDWQCGRARNAAVQVGYAVEPKYVYTLQAADDARVLSIGSLDEAMQFSQHYHLADVPIPERLRAGLGLMITPLITDWEAVCCDYDGVQLTERGADEVAYAITEGVVTSFHSWNCESTLWGAWVFSEVTPYEI